MNARLSQRFPKSRRVLKRSEFYEIAKQSKRIVGRFFVLDYRYREEGECRLGLVVSKKYGGSVVRNRFKRIMREAFRLQCSRFHIAMDFVIRPRKLAQEASLSDIEQELLGFLSQLKG